MNWYKRAKLSLSNLYDSPNYLSEVEKEYAQVNEAIKRLYKARNSSPMVQQKLRELDRLRNSLKMSLQMLNKLTPEEKINKLKARQNQLV